MGSIPAHFAQLWKALSSISTNNRKFFLEKWTMAAEMNKYRLPSEQYQRP
jgi:hypothetical protein